MTEAKAYTNSQIDSIKLGGRNYFKSNTTIYVYNNADFNRNHSECPNGFYLVGTQDSAGMIRIANVINSDGWWSVSFEVRGSQSCSVACEIDICDLGVKTIRTTDDNTWKHVIVSTYIDRYSGNPDIYNFVDITPTWAYFYFRNFKVEKGNKATDWTPAPEDMISKSNMSLSGSTLNITL